MRRSLLLCGVLGLVCVSGAETVPEPQFEGTLAVPKYESGYVLDWDANTYTKFMLYGTDTKPIYSLPLGHAPTIIGAWAADADGTVARAYEEAGHHGEIEVLDLSGKVALTIDTGSYIPTHVTFAPDHTIWTIGYEQDYDRQAEDFSVVRHYSQTGEKLAEALPWSQIEEDNNADTALQLALGGRHLFSSSDRIGFVARTNSSEGKWIEVSFAGNLLGRYDLGCFQAGDPIFSPAAMTSSGDTYAKIWIDRKPAGYAVLDRSSRTWRKVRGYPKGALIGADGDNLVFSQPVGGWTVLHEVAAAHLTVKSN